MAVVALWQSLQTCEYVGCAMAVDVMAASAATIPSARMTSFFFKVVLLMCGSRTGGRRFLPCTPSVDPAREGTVSAE